MIKIFGHSDDCFEIEGKFRGENEYGAYDKKITVIVHDFTNDKSVIVSGEYGPGVWIFSVRPEDEDKPMPEIKIEMYENGYSPALIIDCSENTAVSLIEASNV